MRLARLTLHSTALFTVTARYRSPRQALTPPTEKPIRFLHSKPQNSVNRTHKALSSSIALLSLPTGPIGNGRTILVPYGKDKEVKVILTLEQGNLDVTDYEDIEIALTSTCQNDPTSIHGAISSSV